MEPRLDEAGASFEPHLQFPTADFQIGMFPQFGAHAQLETWQSKIG
jgi:hypothetical protein